MHLTNEGPYLLSIKDAGKALGISYSTLYQMTAQGDIEWVMIGSRKYISRESLMDFIKTNTHKGYYVARRAERTAARGKLSPSLWWQLLADGHWRSRRLLVGTGSGDRVSTSRYPLVSAVSVVVGAPLSGCPAQDSNLRTGIKEGVRRGGTSKMKLCDHGRRYPHPGAQPVYNRDMKGPSEVDGRLIRRGYCVPPRPLP